MFSARCDVEPTPYFWVLESNETHVNNRARGTNFHVQYKGYENTLQGVHPTMYRCKGCNPLYRCCVHVLQALGPTMYQRRGSIARYKGCVDMLHDLDSSMRFVFASCNDKHNAANNTKFAFTSGGIVWHQLDHFQLLLVHYHFSNTKLLP